jgi:hypothetical protein
MAEIAVGIGTLVVKTGLAGVPDLPRYSVVRKKVARPAVEARERIEKELVRK